MDLTELTLEKQIQMEMVLLTVKNIGVGLLNQQIS